ncbi:MAG: M48 family metallopeptidase [Acidobacteriota bacterium]
MKNLAYSFSLLLVLIGLSGCATGVASTSGVSLDEEWQLGQQMAASVQQQVRLVQDPVALRYVRMVGERIHAQTPLANRPFDFEIVDDPDVNAFSIPGGHVYVNRGLINQADKADMLAGVMAHEISHVVARHVIQQMVQQQQINVIGSILLGQNPGALQTLLANVLAGGVLARFSRADEKEADDLGLRFMTAAGYNGQGMVDMFQKLLSLEKGQPGAVEKFFLDHPLTEDRIKDIQSRVRALPPGGITDDPAYQDVRSRM